MENTVEARLRRLFEIQAIDSKIDKIHAVRGELPMEVADLEDEIEGLNTRVERLGLDISELKKEIDAKKQSMKDSDSLIKKYEAQLGDVKNNREYLALTKEVELQKLEKMAAEKKIAEFNQQIIDKQALTKESQELISERNKDLEVKKDELNNITSETSKEEKDLESHKNELRAAVAKRLLNAYDRIRKNVKNGLAVVTIERSSCGGCYSAIPPQRQLDIRMRKKIIVCENCGRILTDTDLAEEVNQLVNKTKASA